MVNNCRTAPAKLRGRRLMVQPHLRESNDDDNHHRQKENEKKEKIIYLTVFILFNYCCITNDQNLAT